MVVAAFNQEKALVGAFSVITNLFEALLDTCLTWCLCVCRISDKERQYIEAGLPATDKDSVAIPWKGIWTSMAFWAILVANFANNWGFHLLLTELPQYLSEIFPDYMNTGTKQGGK